MNAGTLTWIEWARCTQADAELFFPTAESGPVYETQVAAAKAVCAGCPVRVQCLIYAQTALPFGVAGGLTAEERRGRTPVGHNPLVDPPGDGAAGTVPSGRAYHDVESTSGRFGQVGEWPDCAERASSARGRCCLRCFWW